MEFGRVNTSRFNRLEPSEEYLCIRNSRGGNYGAENLSPTCCFLGHLGGL